MSRITTKALALCGALFISGCAGLSNLIGTSWQEDVLLHDGTTIVAQRWQTYGGLHEPFKSPPIKEQGVSFTVPSSGKTIKWISEFSEDIGQANFKLLAVHILKSNAYVVAEPYLCLSYNKWGRPNPPYVFFKHDGSNWQRITLNDFPSEFNSLNVVVATEAYRNAIEQEPTVSIEKVRKFNSALPQPEYKSILREPYPSAAGSCGAMVYNGRGGWTGLGWFKDKKSLSACLNYCTQEKIADQFCPCDSLFKGVEKK